MPQAVKRLADLARDLERDTKRLQQSLLAFEALSNAREPAQVEATLIECLVEPLGLGSVRMYLVDKTNKTAKSVSGPPTSACWRPAAMEQQPSLVAWCATLLSCCPPSGMAAHEHWAVAIHILVLPASLQLALGPNHTDTSLSPSLHHSLQRWCCQHADADRTSDCPVHAAPAAIAAVCGKKAATVCGAAELRIGACRAAKLGISVNITDVSTERRYNAAVDGPAQSALALPLRSGGADGDVLAILSIRKLGKVRPTAPQDALARVLGRVHSAAAAALQAGLSLS